MPIGGIQLLVLAVISVLGSRIQNLRLILMIMVCMVSLLGMVLAHSLSQSNSYGRLVGIWLATILACNIPLSLSLIASNVGGFTKKTTVAAMLFIAYCVGNIVGPQFFLSSQAPVYQVRCIQSIISRRWLCLTLTAVLDWYQGGSCGSVVLYVLSGGFVCLLLRGEQAP